MVELKGPTITLDLYETQEDLIKSGRNGAAIIYKSDKIRHKAALFRVVWYNRDEENWIPYSQYQIREHDPEREKLPQLVITKWLWDRRKQAAPMGIRK